MKTAIDVLVLDDNEDIATMIKTMLQMKQYKVATLIQPHKLLDTLEEYQPKVLLMDMLLANVDGRDLCARLKADSDFNTIKIIMMSAHPGASLDCEIAGSDYFISKPFEMKAMIALLEKAIGSI